MKTLFRLGACVVGAAIFATASTAFAQQNREVSMAIGSLSFASVVPRAAQEMGLYAKHGLDMKFVNTDNASSATTALIAKSVQFALSGPGEIVAAQARGLKVVVIGSAYSGLGGSLVLAKSVADKLGVSPTAPVAQRRKALDGLLIGAPSPTGAYTVAFKGAAASDGATLRFSYMAATATVSALDSGAVQGYIAGAPFWAVPVVKGTAVLWLSGPKGELPEANVPASTANVQVLRDYAEANPDTVKRVLAAHAEVAKAIDERPAEVKAAVAKLYPTIDATTLDLLFTAESVAWKGKQLTAKDIEREIAFMKTTGAPLEGIDKVDPASMVYP
jgi:ABC-type nitrate/sulfonate/bicarbonate transport system substrate-binding protein